MVTTLRLVLYIIINVKMRDVNREKADEFGQFVGILMILVNFFMHLDSFAIFEFNSCKFATKKGKKRA